MKENDWIMNLFKGNKNQNANSEARELYDRLNTDTYKSGSWRTEDNGEDMGVVSQVIMQYWKPRFLMDPKPSVHTNLWMKAKPFAQ